MLIYKNSLRTAVGVTVNEEAEGSKPESCGEHQYVLLSHSPSLSFSASNCSLVLLNAGHAHANDEVDTRQSGTAGWGIWAAYIIYERTR